MDHEELSQAKLMTQSAFFRLEQVWPEAASELRLDLPSLGSIPPAAGTAWTLVGFFEALLREWASQALKDKCAQDPSLQESCRLHAQLDSAFVHQRICKGLLRYVTAGPEMPGREEAIRLLEAASHRLKQDLVALRQMAQWSLASAQLLTAIERFQA